MQRAFRQAFSLAVALVLLTSVVSAAAPSFRSAKPVWPKGRETEMNVLAGFRAAFEATSQDKATLRVAASTIYRAWLNGEFLGCGPARGPHGYFRVDAWPLAGKLKPGKNLVAIEVAGYNANSYYLLDQPSFLQAEVVAGERVLASTGAAGTPFAAQVLKHRVEKVQRYSFQRPFIEVYHLSPDYDRWLRDPAASFSGIETAVQPNKNLLPRRAPYPDFAQARPRKIVGAGTVEKRATVETLWKDRSLVNVGPKLKGYPEKDLELVVSTEMQQYASRPTAGFKESAPAAPIALRGGAYRIVDFGENLTGFLGLSITCVQKARFALVFDEILASGDVDFKRLGCVNAIRCDLQPGSYRLESIEPYTLRYLKLICLDGECRVSRAGDVYLREYSHPAAKDVRFACSDPRLNQLFAAGVSTFRQNTLDVFMDCPSRERAGWLCDSFFTARVAGDLEGRPLVEDAFFENFLLPEQFAHLPDGMLPMCYPADHNDGVFIPNWSLWFVLELEEYASRGGDRTVIEGLRPRVMRLFDFFRQFENQDGLLEKLPSWVFVEWSAANRFVQDVNYPSNMLYAAALAAASRTYHAPALAEKAERIRDVIRRQSFDGKFFVDNAVRRKGKLEVTTNRSEVCQYFAFFFHVASPDTHPPLWQTLRDEFGPDRQKKKLYPEVHAANSFVGNMLRMELLSRNGRRQQILDESIAYLLYMAERTGTLWENVGPTASCNHGFASHIVHTLYRDVLGLRSVDPIRRKVTIELGVLRLNACEGSLMTPDGPLSLRWRADGDQIVYRLRMPADYEARISSATGKKLVLEQLEK